TETEHRTFSKRDTPGLGLGYVSFGKPISTTIKEEGMIVPRSLTKRGDVYIVRFAISFLVPSISSFEQISFNVTVKEKVVAIELIPLKFDKETSIIKTTSSPD